MVPSAVEQRAGAPSASAARSGLQSDFGSTQSRANGDEPRHMPTSSMSQGFGSIGAGKGWGSSIWGNNSLGGSFGSGAGTRESSRTRESGTLLNGNGGDTITGKTGSSSLLGLPETEPWGRQRTPWSSDIKTSAFSAAPGRSTGVSPARHPSLGQNTPSQGLSEPQQPGNYYAAARSASLGQGLLPTGMNNTASETKFNARSTDFTAAGFPNLGRLAETEGTQAAKAPFGKWSNTATVQSPQDRGVSSADYFGQNVPASRNGSLPPSRHGNESGQFPLQAGTFSAFGQNHINNRGNNMSISSQGNFRGFNDVNGTTSGDYGFARLNLDDTQPEPVPQHRSSISAQGGVVQMPSLGLGNQPRQQFGATAQGVSDTVGAAPVFGGLPTDGFNGAFTGFVGEQTRNFRSAERGQISPGSRAYRQGLGSPQYSGGGTPPSTADRLQRHNQNQQSLNNVNAAMIDDRLRGIQQDQNPALFPAQLQPMLAPQFRNQFAQYPFANVNGLNMNAFAANAFLPQQFQMGAMQLNGFMPFSPYAAVQGLVPVMEPQQKQDDGLGYRSLLMDEFRNNAKSKKYELKDIYDHICEFAGDQHGSRFIQAKLETANSDEKERVFKELQPNLLQLMQCVFGNYVIQKFFEHGDQNQKTIMASKMKGHVVSLSVGMYGCRVVQKALDYVLVEQQAALVKELEGHVLRLVKDQNGNHVVQKAIERVPPEHLQFIFDSFTGRVGELAVHPYGCRVIQRMIEHCEPQIQASILAELHAQGAQLIPDQFGNYVTQHIIEHGGPEDRAKIVDLIKANLAAFSKQKFASNVVEKMLVYGTDDQRREIMLELNRAAPGGEKIMTSLVKDQFGNYVIQKLLDTLNDDDHAVFVNMLQPEINRLRRNGPTHTKQVTSIEKKLTRYPTSGFNPPTGPSGGTHSHNSRSQQQSPTHQRGMPTSTPTINTTGPSRPSPPPSPPLSGGQKSPTTGASSRDELVVAKDGKADSVTA